MTDFFESNFFLIISNIIALTLGSIIGFYFKRFHTRDAQYISERAKLRTIFAYIKVEIMENIEVAGIFIMKYGAKTDTVIEIVCSYLSKRKAKKLNRLYGKYKKQENGKGYEPNTIEKIMRFH